MGIQHLCTTSLESAMGLPSDPNIFRFAWHYHNVDSTFVNVLWFRTSGAATDALIEGAGFLASLTASGAFPQNMSTQVTFDDAECRRSDQAGAVTIPNTYATNANGLIGSDSVTSQCSLVIRLQTGLPGRRNRGRFFLGGIAIDYLSAGASRWTDTSGLLTGMCATFLADTNSHGRDPLVVSKKYSSVEQVSSILPRLDGIGTQRRRSDRVMFP
jgi:hypothetical protein